MKMENGKVVLLTVSSVLRSSMYIEQDTRGKF